MSLDSNSWNQRYISKNTGWDIGFVSTPIKDYIDQINNILQQKTEDDAILKLGRSPAFGTKYRTYSDYLKSAQRRQMLQQMYV